MAVVQPVELESDVAEARALFEAYARGLGIDLCFQDFAAELAALPGQYARPDGILYIARSEDMPVGCVAVRKFADGICEMKRLYVAPFARGRGVGKQLAQRAIRFAQSADYDRMRLDTLETMTEAQRLYVALGFTRIPPYRHNPIPGAAFFELDLRQGRDA
jgi:ribosomal protein S18 acetylase RimI-like enzyme